MASPAQIPSPGARIVIRGAEWIVRRLDNASDGGWQLTCDGVSDLVRGRTALFLSILEDQIGILDPAETEFITDESPRHEPSLLHIESHQRIYARYGIVLSKCGIDIGARSRTLTPAFTNFAKSADPYARFPLVGQDRRLSRLIPCDCLLDRR